MKLFRISMLTVLLTSSFCFDASAIKIRITTLHGEIIQTYEIPETIKAIEIFVGDLPEGIYFLNVESATQRQNSFYKIVKF